MDEFDWSSILQPQVPLAPELGGGGVGPMGRNPWAIPEGIQRAQEAARARDIVPPTTPVVAQGLETGTAATIADPLPGATPKPGMPPVQGFGGDKPFPATEDPMTAGGVPPGGVGAALTGNVPIPRGRPTEASAQSRGDTGPAGPISLGGPGGHTPLPGAGPAPADRQKQMAGLAQALKGVTAPKPPELQKISSPNAPRPTGTIKGGGFEQLLMALNAGGGGGRPPILGGR